MSASLASLSPKFYEVKRRRPRKLIGGSMRRPERAWPLSDHSTPRRGTTGPTSARVHRAPQNQSASPTPSSSIPTTLNASSSCTSTCFPLESRTSTS
jgi:hypothetical protein